MEAKIVKFLKEHNHCFVSGEDISRKLNVSRTAVWKHIQHLKECGYEITAQPHLGYQLSAIPDLLLPDEISDNLDTEIMGKKIIAYASTTSTNDAAALLAENGSREGTVVVAEHQTKGRGRLGREWVSPGNTGLYFSLVLRPDISPAEAGKITLMIAVSVARVLRDSYGVAAAIKWPNDVYLDNEKVCGILTEMNAEQDLINFVIVGIGINVNSGKSGLPAGATSIKIKRGDKIDRIRLLQRLLREIETLYGCIGSKNFAKIIQLWRDYSLTLGCRVSVKWRNAVLEGQAMDVDESGALMVRDDLGFVHHVHSGDVAMVRME